MSQSQHEFRVNMPGILKILAESLYSDKRVAIRELIQNAQDSCTRRANEQNPPRYQPRIHISIESDTRSLIIADNGSGLTAEEVTDYLSTIGRSYTRELGETLSYLKPEQAEALIGQFGLGFLSAFLIAEEVILTTQSYKPHSPAIEWRSSGSIHYETRQLTQTHEVGTRVQLKLKPQYTYLLSHQTMISTLRRFADYLPTPIHVGKSEAPVNVMQPPWEQPESEIAISDAIQRNFGVYAPLAVIVLQDYTLNLGHDSVRIPLSGFLFIPPGTTASIQEYGDLVVYLRRMFITDGETQLLPDWARFVRGMIDCPYLQPTASREDLQHESNYKHVQRALAQQLQAGLKRIAAQQPEIWRHIVNGHRGIIMAWAAKDDAFMSEIAEIVTFYTSRGQYTLPDYRRETGDKLYYMAYKEGSLQEEVLGEGYDVPVINATWRSETIFLKKYAEKHHGVELVQLGDDAQQLIHPVADAQFDRIIAYYRQRGIRAQVANFQPAAIPALITYPKNAEFIQDSREALDTGNLPPGLSGLVSDYVSKLNVDDEALRGTLQLNINNGLIKQLGALHPSQARDAVLDVLLQLARIFAGRMMNSADVAESFQQTTQALTTLLPDGTRDDD